MTVLEARREIVNGSRAVMASRIEKAQSLDYAPTPPWATRALMERVIPRITKPRPILKAAWEPACGEGHMAEVLREYFQTVLASDIYDYGYGHVGNFLTMRVKFVGWIITNPPFGTRATEFMVKALDTAPNVAMFLQLRYLEGLGRYQQIFHKFPPTQIAFFVERVPLHMGRWEPEGTTATAYCWIVWMQGRKPRPPMWIPPTCRQELTKADDVKRFTKSPVRKRR